MTALAIFAELCSLNVVLSIDDEGRLAFDAPADVMIGERLDRVRSFRNELFAIVERMEERAAIREFDAGLPREEAERLARLELTQCRATIVQLSTVACAHCRGCSLVDDPRGSRCATCGRLAWIYQGTSHVRLVAFEDRITKRFSTSKETNQTHLSNTSNAQRKNHKHSMGPPPPLIVSDTTRKGRGTPQSLFV